MTESTLPDWIHAYAQSEPADSENSPFLCSPLHQRGLLAWEGEDAARFLQGQLTCDVNALQPGQATLGACCEPKGRMLASFHVIRTETGFLLDLSRDLLRPLQDALSKYAMLFRKLTVRDASDDYRRLAVWGPQAAPALEQWFTALPENPGDSVAADQVRLLKLPVVDGWQIWLPTAQTDRWLERITAAAPPVTPDRWQLQEIRAGLGWVVAASSGLWIPQMLNYGNLGAISFSKGCYTGQEIIARLQYRGEQKRHCLRLLARGQTDPLPQPGSRIENREGKNRGELVAIARTGEHDAELLAVLQGNMGDQEQLQIGGLKLVQSIS